MGAGGEILGYLVQTVTSLFMLAVLLRFLLQLTRADFYNPISQFLIKATNPVVVPLRRVIPSVAGLDMSTVLLAVALQIVAIVVMLLLNGFTPPNMLVLLMWSFLGVAGLIVNIFFFALLGMIILSWIAPGSPSPAVMLLYQLTEPVMAPFRKLLPPIGGLDLSPILVFILINVIQIALRHMAAGVGLPSALVLGL